MTAPNPTKLDMPQVLNRVFDEDNGLLRTSSQATIVNADIDVSLDASEDNVAVKSSTGIELKIEPDGSINVNTGNILQGLKYDEGVATYNSTQDIFVFKLASVTQATLTLNYTDSTKRVLSSWVRT